MIWIVFWSSWFEMMRSALGPKKVSSSNVNGMAIRPVDAGYVQKMCFELLTSNIRLLPRSAINK